MDYQQHFLYPSSIFANREPYLINTILGSCVAVCLYDSFLKIGGINHFMLPLWNGVGLASPKFGNIATQRLYEKMLSLGSEPRNLKAKVFGGSEIIQSDINAFRIGERNSEIAFDILKELKVSVQCSSVGGKIGRKIQFNTYTGEVLQKMIEKQNNANIIEFAKT